VVDDRSLLYGGIFLLVTVLFGFVSPGWALLGVPVILLTGLLFGSLGLLFTSLTPNIEMYSYYFTIFLTPLFLFSNIFFPLEERFPQWAVVVAKLTPLYHAVEVMRAWTGGTFEATGWFSLIYLMVAGTVLLYLATRFLERRLLK
jgi:lipooligosaccharide transport system permease protein